jgi:hypothetical protein
MLNQDKSLPPLNEADKDLHLGKSFKTELVIDKCNHDLEVIASTHARCKKCSAGWTGEHIEQLVNASRQNT